MLGKSMIVPFSYTCVAEYCIGGEDVAHERASRPKRDEEPAMLVRIFGGTLPRVFFGKTR